MAIKLFSGLPGHGKTLRCLQVVEQLRQQSGRPVFYHRIADLTLPWQKIEDPKKWMELPHGAILVIDEAHETFPKRPPGSKPPEHVEKLAVHRHQGIDIFLVTQHAQNQVDHFVRGLIDEHEHVVRLFGSERSRIHRWPTFQEAPNDYHAKKEALTEIWSFPREIFSTYKSAEVHTVKRRLPWKIIAGVVGGLAAIGLLVWFAMTTLFGSVDASTAVSSSSSSPLAATLAPGGSGRAGVTVDARSYSPAVEGVPFSAPFYREALKVQSAPMVGGCGRIRVGSRTDCFCTDQQGNRLNLEKRACLQYFEYGQFRFDREGEDYYPKVEAYVPPLAQEAPDQVMNPPAPGQAPQAPAGAAQVGGDVSL